MLDLISKLEKILLTEKSRGYDNKAVFGGIEKFLPYFQSKIGEFSQTSGLFNQIETALIKYSGLDVQNRQILVEHLLTLLSSFSRRQQITETKISTLNDEGIHLSDETFFSPLEIIHGIGPQTSNVLKRMGLITLRDLLSHYPYRYEDFSKLKTINQLHVGDVASIVGKIKTVHQHESKQRRLIITEVVLSDITGSLRVSWFNQPWLRNQIAVGKDIVISGKVDIYLGRLTMNSPDWEELEKEHLHTNRIVPVYSTSSGLSQKNLRRIIHKTISFWSPRIKDPLPTWIIKKENLISFSSALSQIHFPDNQERLLLAKERLSFDEILLLQIGVFQQKYFWSNLSSDSFEIDDFTLSSSINSLPFQLTKPQLAAINDIRADLSRKKPMHRLIQGDVGSGKTIVAAISMEIILRSGAQVAFMAPTSILAEQHFRTLSSFLIDRGIITTNQIALLEGEIPAKIKQELNSRIANGDILVIIGTHALLQSSVNFSNLQMVVIDEQHRFGVSQRAILREKAHNPHVLVLTATPIPRSLALTLYGDLDISVVDQMPIGRKKIITKLYSPSQRNEVYKLVHEQVNQGHQAFFVYPLIEGGVEDAHKSVMSEVKRLQTEIFPNFKLELLHGRMKANEKEKILTSFRDGLIHILVSTTVIEVGMDIPNATIIVIESANRFGLAQLHQIRGRVGRSDTQSFCLLISENDEKMENERLAAMIHTNDGFKLAEYDLRQRGPGDFLGKRQSGFWGMKLTNIADVKMIQRARRIANEIIQKDPNLLSPENEDLRIEVKRAIPEHFGERS